MMKIREILKGWHLPVTIISRRNPMKPALFILKKYWRAHKGKAFILLLSIILMTAMLCTVLLLERTSSRRELHRIYDLNGSYDHEATNVDDTLIEYVQSSDMVDEWGLLYLCGNIRCGSGMYHLGGFVETATELAHYPMTEGRMPAASGEIAMTEQIRNTLFFGCEIGSTVTLPIYDWSGAFLSEQSYQLVGVFDGANRNTFKDTETNPYSEPQAVLSYEDAKAIPGGAVNLLLTLKGDGRYHLFAADDPQKEPYMQFLSNMPPHTSTTGGRAAALQGMSGSMQGMETGEQIPSSNQTKMLRIVSALAAIVAVISLFSGISVVMQKRRDSFQILRRIGFSVRQLRGMLCIECLILFIAGVGLGLLFGLLFYELLYWIQTALLDMPAYRGYTAEWLVRKRTADPWSIPIIAGIVTTMLAYSIPVWRIGNPRSAKSFKTGRAFRYSLFHAVSKILSQRSVEVLQAVSLVCVMTATMIGYFYCTSNGKDKQLLEGIGSIYEEIVAEDYTVSGGLDLQELGLDCELAGPTEKEASMMSMYRTAGITEDTLRLMQEKGAAEVYGYSRPFHLLIYPNSEEDVLHKMELDSMFSDLFQKQQPIAAIPCVLLSDALMEQLSNTIGEPLTEGILYCSPVDTMPEGVHTLLCVQGDENGWYPVKTEEKQLTFAKSVHIKTEELGAYPILQNALTDTEAMTELPGFGVPGIYAVMSGSYAAEQGFYQQTYDEVLLGLREDAEENDLNALIAETLPADSGMSVTTRFMLYDKYVKASINAYSTIIFLFALLLAIHVIGYCNVWNLRLQVKSDRIAILRSLGLSKRRLQFQLALQTLKIPVVSVLLSTFLVRGFQCFMEYQYHIYQDFYDSAYSGDFSDWSNRFALAAEQSQAYMLNAGMWMPDWKLPMLMLAVVVCGFSIISVLLLLRKQTDNEIITAIRTEE